MPSDRKHSVSSLLHNHECGGSPGSKASGSNPMNVPPRGSASDWVTISWTPAAPPPRVGAFSLRNEAQLSRCNPRPSTTHSGERGSMCASSPSAFSDFTTLGHPKLSAFSAYVLHECRQLFRPDAERVRRLQPLFLRDPSPLKGPSVGHEGRDAVRGGQQAARQQLRGHPGRPSDSLGHEVAPEDVVLQLQGQSSLSQGGSRAWPVPSDDPYPRPVRRARMRLRAEVTPARVP
jgi:hypothetical protein